MYHINSTSAKIWITSPRNITFSFRGTAYDTTIHSERSTPYHYTSTSTSLITKNLCITL